MRQQTDRELADAVLLNALVDLHRTMRRCFDCHLGVSATFGEVHCSVTREAIAKAEAAIAYAERDQIGEVEEREPNQNRPIGECQKCHTPVYIDGGFCGVCRR